MSQPQLTASSMTGLVESVGHIGHVAFPFVAADRAASAAMVLWSVIGAVVLVDLVWGAAVGLSVGGWWLPVLAAAMLLFVAWLYQHRSPILSDTAHTASLWICFTAAGCVLTYLGATCALPLQDAALTRVDQSFGFDWLAWRDAVETWPKLKFLLELAYGSLIPQFLLSSLLLPALGRTKRSVEPILLAAMTLLPTTAVSALWPALGPFAALGGERVEYLPHVVMLRAPGPWHFDIPTMQGILTMPSYHAVLALLFIYAFRNTGLLGWGIGTVNAVMLVSIAPVGGHYLADIMAGAIIAVVCIVAIRCLATPGLPRSA